MFPNQYGINGDESLGWGLSGMDYKELFAGLFDGEGTSLLDDLIAS
jgi:hypothetical protein